jgi:hypothetical protein
MHKAICNLKSVSPYSQSAPFGEKKTKNETHEEFENRTWRQRGHFNDEGNMFIPPMAFKNCLSEAAKYKSIQIPGKGKSTYTKHFEAGVLVVEPLILDVTKDTVESHSVFVPSDGRRGGTTRVWKTFPWVPRWEGTVEFLVLDELINEEVFANHLEDAGSFIGLGRFRPRNNGYFGRFAVEHVRWIKSA